MTQNQIAYWNMVYDNRHKERADAEAARSNYAREVETNRSNVRNEALKAGDVFGNLELNQNKLYETQRHNLADEQIRSSGTLLNWTEAGLNPLWYTNAPTAIATGAVGLATLPTQQEVATNNANALLGEARKFRKEADIRIKETKPVVQQFWSNTKEKIGNAYEKVRDSTKSIASNLFDSYSAGMNQRQRSRTF